MSLVMTCIDQLLLIDVGDKTKRREGAHGSFSSRVIGQGRGKEMADGEGDETFNGYY